MEDLGRLNGVLKTINTLCFQIQKRMLKIMKTIQKDGINIAEYIQESKPHLDSHTLLRMLQDECLNFLNEPEEISKEIDVFSSAIANGAEPGEDCSILRDVWSGDAYDGKMKYDGLLALKEELETKKKNSQLEHIVQTIVQLGETPPQIPE